MPSAPNNPRLYCVVLLSLLGVVVLGDRIAALTFQPGSLFFRGWEYVSGAGRYNNARRSIIYTQREYGDLGNMLGVDAYKQWRMNTYTMDDEGYRNAHGARNPKAKVLLVGDSFISGVGNTDDDTFAVRLQAALGRPVEPYVPGDLSLLLREKRFPESVKGSLLVWGRVERNLTSEDGEMAKWLRDSVCFAETPREKSINDAKTWVKRLIGGLTEYFHISPLRRLGQHLFQELRFAVTGGHASSVVVPENGSDILFFTKDVGLLSQSADDRQMTSVADAIAHARDCLGTLGISLLVVTIPDKSHVYVADVPASRKPAKPLSPDPLEVLEKLLRGRKIASVNLTPAFIQQAKNAKRLYWNDDTHWNPTGINLAAVHTASAIKKLKLK